MNSDEEKVPRFIVTKPDFHQAGERETIMHLFSKIAYVACCWYHIARLVGYLVLMAVSEWFWLGWYLLSGTFDPAGAVRRIACNRFCPRTVLPLYVWYRLKSRS